MAGWLLAGSSATLCLFCTSRSSFSASTRSLVQLAAPTLHTHNPLTALRLSKRPHTQRQPQGDTNRPAATKPSPCMHQHDAMIAECLLAAVLSFAVLLALLCCAATSTASLSPLSSLIRDRARTAHRHVSCTAAAQPHRPTGAQAAHSRDWHKPNKKRYAA